jgi:hypothetical protein
VNGESTLLTTTSPSDAVLDARNSATAAFGTTAAQPIIFLICCLQKLICPAGQRTSQLLDSGSLDNLGAEQRIEHQNVRLAQAPD